MNTPRTFSPLYLPDAAPVQQAGSVHPVRKTRARLLRKIEGQEGR
ncbi:MAG: hypothetical protein ABMA02_14070 [Saprospiraceae bacterium]